MSKERLIGVANKPFMRIVPLGVLLPWVTISCRHFHQLPQLGQRLGATLMSN